MPGKGGLVANDVQPGLDPDKYYLVIGIGDTERPESIRFYYVDHRRAGRTLVLFSTPEEAERYVRTSLESPGAYMDLLESGGLDGSQALRRASVCSCRSSWRT
jgi:hypothetical protein